MKRNQMLDLMEARMEFYRNKYPEANSRMVVDYVLKGMEAVGMNPPKIKRHVKPTSSPKEFNPSFEYDEFVNEWES